MIVFLTCITPYSKSTDILFDLLEDTSENTFFEDVLIECTTGLASGVATPDGRPLLWKNRDLGGGSNQEFHYKDYGNFPYISITYAGETDEYYGGINAIGFAIENSNSYNLEPGPWRSGWGYGDDDGYIMAQALATCRTVDDFQVLLDSLNVNGRTLNCNYGVIDAFGGAAMFETAGYTYERCDAEDAPGGFLVRSNYSYSGYRPNNPIGGWGGHRHNAAYRLFREAVEQRQLTAQYILQRVVRDISIQGLDPNPLPFDGYWQNYPYGCIPISEAVCRSTTRGVMVAQGVRPGQRPDDAILWAMAGSPISSIAVPLWVRAGSVPIELDGPQSSRICDRAITLLSPTYGSGGAGVVDTWKLTNPQRTGLWDFTLRLESFVFDKTERFVSSPYFSYDLLRIFQNEVAQQVADSMVAFRFFKYVNEIATPGFNNSHLVLQWGSVEIPQGIREYRIFRSPEPFRDGINGELLGTVTISEFIDTNPLPCGGYYRVEVLE